MPKALSIFPMALAVAAALSSAPVLANDDGLAATRERLADPQAQLAAAAALAALSQSILDIRIEPLVRAMRGWGGDGMDDLPPDARLGDIAGSQARDLPADVARSVPRIMGSSAAMAGALEQMLPELRQTARRMKDALPGY